MVLAVYASKAARLGTLHSALFRSAALLSNHGGSRCQAPTRCHLGPCEGPSYARGAWAWRAGWLSQLAGRADGHGAGRVVRRSVARSRSRPRRHVARGMQTGIYTHGVCCGAPQCAVRGVDRHPGGVPCDVPAPITLAAACAKDLKHGSEAHHDPMRVDRVFRASCSLLRVRARPAASRVCH